MRRWMTMLGLAMAGSVACAPRADTQVDSGAHAFTVPIERVSREDMLAYARRMHFDTSYAAADVRQLVWRERGRTVVGPYAEIAPERSAYRLSSAQLAQGRVIARVRTTGPIPPLGVPAGVSYLWVDSTRSGRRLIVIPESPTEPLRQLPLGIREHQDTTGRPMATRAAFQLEAGGGVQMPCKPWGCCCIDPGSSVPPCDPPIWRGTSGPQLGDFADLIRGRIINVTVPGLPR
jgi:hypothetical protein